MWGATAEITYVSEGVITECPEDPVKLLGAPIGMYHCPICGCMQIAGFPHVHEVYCALGLWDGEFGTL
jgi:hypothetical protein